MVFPFVMGWPIQPMRERKSPSGVRVITTREAAELPNGAGSSLTRAHAPHPPAIKRHRILAGLAAADRQAERTRRGRKNAPQKLYAKIGRTSGRKRRGQK